MVPETGEDGGESERDGCGLVERDVVRDLRGDLGGYKSVLLERRMLLVEVSLEETVSDTLAYIERPRP